MKTTSRISTSAAVIRIIMVIGVIILALTHTAEAQYRGKSKFYLGLQGHAGTRSFNIKSDIEALDGVHIEQEGFSYGVMFGGDVLQFNLRNGFYNSTPSTLEIVKVTEYDLSMNIFPLQMARSKNAYLRPYLTAGVMFNSMTFRGSYEVNDPMAKLKKELEEAKAKAAECCCADGSGSGPAIPTDPAATSVTPSSANSGPMADPDMPVTPIAEESNPDKIRETGKMADVRLNVGAGFMLMVPLRGSFFKLFGEVKYGVPIASLPGTAGFLNTKITNPVSMNLGIGIGLKNY